MAKIKQQVRLPYATAPNVVFEGDTVSTQRYDDVYYNHYVGGVTSVSRPQDGVFLVESDGSVHLRIEIWSDDLIRFFFSYGREGEDFSYARDPEVAPQSAEIMVRDGDSVYQIDTATLEINLNKADASVRIVDRASGLIVHEYAAPFYARFTLMKGLDQVRLQFRTDRREGFFGLGDKAWDTDLNGRCFENWNSDSFAYGRERDALYRTIPFFYGLRSGHAYGIFLDNSYRSHFDFNSHADGITTVWADGGSFDYYFINGPKLDAVAARYVRLTGVPELPPSGPWATTSAAGATTRRHG